MGYVPVASLSLIVSSILVVQSIYSIPYKDLRILRINIQLSLLNFFVSLAVCISVVVEGNYPFVLTVFVTLPLSIVIGTAIYNSRCQKIIHLFADSSAIFLRDLSQIMKDRIHLRKPYIDFYFRFLNSGAKLWYDDYTHSPFSVILESITVHHLLHCSKQQTCFCSKVTTINRQHLITFLRNKNLHFANFFNTKKIIIGQINGTRNSRTLRS